MERIKSKKKRVKLCRIVEAFSRKALQYILQSSDRTKAPAAATRSSCI